MNGLLVNKAMVDNPGGVDDGEGELATSGLSDQESTVGLAPQQLLRLIINF